MNRPSSIGRGIAPLNLVGSMLWGAVGIVAGGAGFTLFLAWGFESGVFGRVVENAFVPGSSLPRILFIGAVLLGFLSLFLLHRIVGSVRPRPGEAPESTYDRGVSSVGAAGVACGVLYAAVMFWGQDISSHWKSKIDAARMEAFRRNRYQVDTLGLSRSGADTTYTVEIPLSGTLAGEYSLVVQVVSRFPDGILWEQTRRMTLNRATSQTFRFTHAELERTFCSLPDERKPPAGRLAPRLRVYSTLTYDRLPPNQQNRIDLHAWKQIPLYTEFDCQRVGQSVPGEQGRKDRPRGGRS